MRGLLSSIMVLGAVTATGQEAAGWRVGASMGVGSPAGMVGMVEGRSRGSGGLFVERREAGRRLGFRLEFSQRGELAGNPPGGSPYCAGCLSSTDRSERAVLLTLNWEFREGRRFQPYALLGMGVHRMVDTERTNFSCVAGGSCAPRQDFTSQSPIGRDHAALALGAGAAWSFGRVAPFVEARLGPAAEVFQFGFRVRPF